MRRSRANKLKKKAEFQVAQEQDPEARREIKGKGLTVGKLVLYCGAGEPQNGATRYGTVKVMHRESVVIQVTVGKVMTGGENAVLREDEVPFAQIVEIIGEGHLADPALEPAWNKEYKHNRIGIAPPRENGYEYCDIGQCEKPPIKAYLVRKVEWNENHTEGKMGTPKIVAVCRDHDEKYEEPSEPNKIGVMQTPANFPLLWQMGVPFDEYSIPRKVEEAGQQPTSPATNVTFENCWCGKEYGHKGFHRKVEEDD